MSREEKSWDLRSLVPEARQRLCVEEPFFVHRNIGYTADNESFRGIHLELRQAFSLLADGAQLDKCCDVWVEETFTSLGDSGIFQKPAPAPKPTLTSATAASPRGGRAGPNNRGGRGNSNQRSNQSSRRNSSGTTFSNGRYNNPLPSPGLHPAASYGSHIHDLLLQRYIALEHERAQMENILRASQAHPALAQANLFATAGQPSPLAGSPHQSQFSNSQPSPHLPEGAMSPTPGYVFRYPMQYEQGQRQSAALSTSQEGFRTNPNSPTLATRVPVLGREPQRSSVNGGIPNGSIRSQSQPARTASLQLPQGYSSMSMLMQDSFRNPGRPPVSLSPELPQNILNLDLPLRQGRGYSVSQGDYGPPREYLGYSIGESPRMDPQTQDMPVPPNRTFFDESRRSSRGSPDLVPPRSHFYGHPSRSPSPLRHARSFSAAGVHFGPVPHTPGLSSGSSRLDAVQNPADHGLLISTGGALPLRSPPHDRTPPAINHMGPLVDEPESLSVSENSDHGSGRSWDMPPPSQPVIANGSGSLAQSGLGDDPWVTVERQASGVPTVAPQSRSPNNPSKPFQSANGHVPQQPSLHIRSPNHDAFVDKIPLLSPVEESRTPSPTASRRHPHHLKQASMNSLDSKPIVMDPKIVTNKENRPGPLLQLQQQQQPPPPTRHTAPPPPPLDTARAAPFSDKTARREPSGSASAVVQTNGWQQQVSKRSTRKRAKSGPSQKLGGGGATSSGTNTTITPNPTTTTESKRETMPLDASERKGG